MKRLAAMIFAATMIFCAAARAADSPAALYPPMDNGVLDPADRPFDYFSKSTTVIGPMYAEDGTEITPEGTLYTGYAEMGFFAGPKLSPVNQRVKTLERGYLPIVNMEFSVEGVNYKIVAYGVTLDGTPDGVFVNMIRATMTNPGAAPAEARFGAGMRSGRNILNRIQHHASDLADQLKHPTNRQFKYSLKPDAALRTGDVIFTYNVKPDEEFAKEGEMYDLNTKGMSPAQPNDLDWLNIAAWKRTLAPGESFAIDFVMPFEPAKPQMMKKFQALNFDELLAKTADGWESWLAGGTAISIPEKKINDMFRANLIYLAIAMDKEGSDYVQKVNEFQYDAFWLRDGSFMLTAYGELGHPFEDEQGSLYFLKFQTEGGNFESQKGQLDGFGQTLWTFGRHYELTRDKAYMEKVWPAAMRALKWLHDTRQKEKDRLGDETALGYGLMPISNPGDNELVDGHVVGHDAWALHGLEMLRRAAPDIATPDETAALNAEIADYKKWFDFNLNEIVKRTGGFITPAVEPGGNDWGNLKLIWPTHVLDPLDARVTETFRMAHYKYAEGIMTYDKGNALHDYIGIDIPISELSRGEQTQALKEFYALVAHTASTHGGFEASITPWGDRNFGSNIAPHGCFAGKWLLLYRAMLVREDGQDLHLGSALSPFWLRPGKKIEVNNAPTSFGPVSFSVVSRDGGAAIQIQPPKRNPPDRIIIHLPDGYEITGVTAEGTVIEQSSDHIVFSSDTTKADITWNVGKPADFTFRKTVEDYLGVYWKLHKPDGAKGAVFDED